MTSRRARVFHNRSSWISRLGCRTFSCGSVQVMSSSPWITDELMVEAVSGFAVEQRGVGGWRLVGELDAFEAPALRTRFAEMGGDVELDCSGLTFVDVAGLRALVALRAGCQARGAKLSIVHPSRRLVRLVELTDLEGL